MKNNFFDKIDLEDVSKIYPRLKQDLLDVHEVLSQSDEKPLSSSSKKERVKTSLYISPKLLRRLKIFCAKESQTMADVLENCIIAFLDRKEKLQAKRDDLTD